MLAKITNIYPVTILISEKNLPWVERTKIPCLVLIVVAFFAAMILFASFLPRAFAHGGHQPPVERYPKT
jgi:hypothetical protein